MILYKFQHLNHICFTASEEDIDQQIIECKKKGIRFCLPTSKTIKSVNDEDSDDDCIVEKVNEDSIK